jgi:hypothetical protein
MDLNTEGVSKEKLMALNILENGSKAKRMDLVNLEFHRNRAMKGTS